MLARLVFVAALAAGATFAQAPFPLREIANLRDLGSGEDDPSTANPGFAIANAEEDGTIRVEGKDDAGNPWRLWLPRDYVGATRVHVYQADLDANGRDDVLFVNVIIGNGECIGHATVTTLMFDSVGRPVPWRMESQAITEPNSVPVSIVDLNGDHRAEIITSDCTYARRPTVELAEDRWITGIYEAHETVWRPMNPPAIKPYLQVIKPHFPDFEPGYLQWVASSKPLSPDPLEGWGERPHTKLTGLLTGEIGCPASELGLSDGTPQDGPCAQFAQQEAPGQSRYADGSVRAGWPAVVTDSISGREIRLEDTLDALEKIMAAGFPVRLYGPEAAPAILWADAVSDPATRQIRPRLGMRVIRSVASQRAGPKSENPTPQSGAQHFDTGTLVAPRAAAGVPQSPQAAPPEGGNAT